MKVWQKIAVGSVIAILMLATIIVIVKSQGAFYDNPNMNILYNISVGIIILATIITELIEHKNFFKDQIVKKKNYYFLVSLTCNLFFSIRIIFLLIDKGKLDGIENLYMQVIFYAVGIIILSMIYFKWGKEKLEDEKDQEFHDNLFEKIKAVIIINITKFIAALIICFIFTLFTNMTIENSYWGFFLVISWIGTWYLYNDEEIIEQKR